VPRRILKWNVPVDDVGHPIGAGPVVLVGCQVGIDSVQVWTDETDADTIPVVSARVYATGQPLPAHDEHVGSVVVGLGFGSSLVWHVLRSTRG
jgi:hypothetical protein